MWFSFQISLTLCVLQHTYKYQICGTGNTEQLRDDNRAIRSRKPGVVPVQPSPAHREERLGKQGAAAPHPALTTSCSTCMALVGALPCSTCLPHVTA